MAGVGELHRQGRSYEESVQDFLGSKEELKTWDHFFRKRVNGSGYTHVAIRERLSDKVVYTPRRYIEDLKGNRVAADRVSNLLFPFQSRRLDRNLYTRRCDVDEKPSVPNHQQVRRTTVVMPYSVHGLTMRAIQNRAQGGNSRSGRNTKCRVPLRCSMYGDKSALSNTLKAKPPPGPLISGIWSCFMVLLRPPSHPKRYLDLIRYV